MARFAADSRLGRLLALGGLIAVGWLLGLIFGFIGAAPASADSYVPSHQTAMTSTGKHHTPRVAPERAVVHGFPALSDNASDNAEAMAGRDVDGLTSQSKPALPAPSAGDRTAGTHGLVPQPTGGSGPFGPGLGDVVRSGHDLRLMVLSAPVAAILPPVVRTAADDPSFSPD
jgi:hypothetical protein